MVQLPTFTRTHLDCANDQYWQDEISREIDEESNEGRGLPMEQKYQTAVRSYAMREFRLTIGKHKRIDGTKVPGTVLFPFGITFIVYPGQQVKLVNDREFDIDLRHGFGDGRKFTAMTIDGGVPFYKFLTPTEPSDTYHVFKWTHSGIKWQLETRMVG